MEVAVIGTGPAAFSVVSALSSHIEGGGVRVTLLGPAGTRPAFALRGRDPRTWTAAEYDALHQQLKRLGGGGFPPPRTQYGSLLEKCLGDLRTTLYRTDYFGGLGEFWSTAMFPFRERDFRNWPIGHGEMSAYYRRVADLVGIAGEPDGFRNSYPDTFVNRPAVRQTPLAVDLTRSLARRGSQGPRFKIRAAANQLAVETRADESNACEYCGGCFYGCFKDALFRPGAELEKLIARGTISWLPRAVVAVSSRSDGDLEVDLGSGSTKRFQKVFLCAGAIGSSEIISRSLGISDHDVFIDDNEMYNFPILYYGAQKHRFTDHFSISATAVTIEPVQAGCGESGHLLVAALPSLMFDYYVPKRLADRVRGLVRFVQGRFLIGQMYVDGATAARYALRVDRDGHASIRPVRSGASDARARLQIAELARALRGSRFAPLRLPLMRVSSSYHYVGGFPFGNPLVPVGERCEILPGLFACDSMVFPDSPAQPLTFTIMANAMRVATLAMG